MRLYLDNSLLNRPFDDQRQPRIWIETLSLALILQTIEAGEAELVRSPIHALENAQSPDATRRAWVNRCLGLAKVAVRLTPSIRTRANVLAAAGLKPLDALHLACAEAGRATYFLTCDDRLLKRYTGKIPVLNPVEYVLTLR